MKNDFPLSGYVRPSRVSEFLDISPATMWRWAAKSEIPKSRKLSSRVTVFDAAEIRRWLAAKSAD